MHKGRLRLFLILVLLSALGVALWLWLNRPKAVSVTVREVDRGLVEETVANTRAGTIKACQRSGLSPSIGGQIVQLPIKEGDRVKQGQLLMAFWNEDLAAQLELAQRQVEAARGKARQACVVAETAEREAQRLESLRAKRLASDEVTDRAIGEAKAQRAACDAARTSIEVSRAEVAVARAALQRTRLTAPFSGIAAEINGEMGEYVTPSPVGVPTPPAVDLIDTGCLFVSAPMDEVDAPRIQLQMPARISLDAFGEKIFPGKVRRIAPYVLEQEKQARTVEVEVVFNDAADRHNLLPGYSADVEIILARTAAVLRVPTEAVMEGNQVLIVAPDRILQARRIETGLSNWEYTEVLSGLKAGDQVVVSVDREGVEAGALARIE